MFAVVAFVVSVATLAVAQQISFRPGTGVRSLWIPFKTVSGTPLASIAGNDSTAAITTYVVACPTADPSCSLAPNLTVTEGISSVGYSTANSAGVAYLGCDLQGTTSAVCSNHATGNGDIQKATTSVGADQIVYQAVAVTATMNTTSSTMPATVTVPTTVTHTTTATTTNAAATGAGKAPWAVGSVVGAGLIAIVALQ